MERVSHTPRLKLRVDQLVGESDFLRPMTSHHRGPECPRSKHYHAFSGTIGMRMVESEVFTRLFPTTPLMGLECIRQIRFAKDQTVDIYLHDDAAVFTRRTNNFRTNWNTDRRKQNIKIIIDLAGY